MKIIRKKSNNHVMYFLNDNDEVILSETGLSGKYTNLSINNNEFELIENTLPLLFNYNFGLLSYDNGFHIVNKADYDIAENNFNELNRVSIIKDKMELLESTITPRRTREAILGTDNGWLADIELQIQELRGQL